MRSPTVSVTCFACTIAPALLSLVGSKSTECDADSAATCSEMGKNDVGAGAVGAAPGQDPWAQTTHPTMATDGWNWTQLFMSREGNFPKGDIKYMTAEDIEQNGAMWLWHKTFARSIPGVIKGLAKPWAKKMKNWTLGDYRQQWGHLQVIGSFDSDPRFNRGIAHPTYGRVVRQPARQRLTVAEFIDLSDRSKHSSINEHVSIQQSGHNNLEVFGLPDLPPYIEDLVKHTLQARNVWMAVPPKVSVLHYDWQDSVLLQIAGKKRVLLIDPARLHTAYPCIAYAQVVVRKAPGVFEHQTITTRELDNFPLVNVTHPDLERHPLFKDAHTFTAELNPGDALVLPSYWFHQVESFAPKGKLNMAVNFWFQGHSLLTRLYRTLRENLFINCTEPAAPGRPHPCRE